MAPNRGKGFTLIEMLVAITVTAIIFVPLAFMLSRYAGLIGHSERTSVSTNLTRAQIHQDHAAFANSSTGYVDADNLPLAGSPNLQYDRKVETSTDGDLTGREVTLTVHPAGAANTAEVYYGYFPKDRALPARPNTYSSLLPSFSVWTTSGSTGSYAATRTIGYSSSSDYKRAAIVGFSVFVKKSGISIVSVDLSGNLWQPPTPVLLSKETRYYFQFPSMIPIPTTTGDYTLTLNFNGTIGSDVEISVGLCCSDGSVASGADLVWNNLP